MHCRSGRRTDGGRRVRQSRGPGQTRFHDIETKFVELKGLVQQILAAPRTMKRQASDAVDPDRRDDDQDHADEQDHEEVSCSQSHKKARSSD